MVPPPSPKQRDPRTEYSETTASAPLIVRAARRLRVPARRVRRAVDTPQPASPSWTSSYRLMDWATQILLAGVAVLLVLYRHQAPPLWPWLVTGHLVLIALIHGWIRTVARGSSNRALHLLREGYPILFYTLFFRETELINRIVGMPRLDPQFLLLEHRIFGTQPGVALMNALPYRWVSEVLYASYFSYYVMIVGIGLWLLWRNRAAFRHFISVVTLVFYGCYVFYMAVPVIGPRLLFRPTPERDWFQAIYPGQPLPGYPDAVPGGIFFELMALIYRHLEALSAAFPSSHVAVAVTTLWFSWRYVRPIRWVHAVAVALLCVSTVYCHYHYAVDVPGGILAAMLLIPLANWLYARCDVTQQASRAADPDPFGHGLLDPGARE